VGRERRHIDLDVRSGTSGEGLVLENKVTALPDVEQLKRYVEDVRTNRPDVAARSGFVLLSLVAPPTALPDPWRWVSYRELSPALEEVAGAMPPGFDADFTRRYAELTGQLADLVHAAGVDGHLDEPYFLVASLDARLREAGVRDLVLKVRTVQLVQGVVEQVPHVPAARYEAGWSRGNPLAAYFTKEARTGDLGDFNLGWQLQGRQLRLAAVLSDEEWYGTGPTKRADREAAADEHLAGWLDPRSLDVMLPGRLVPNAGRLPYNHFAPDFVYRYALVTPEITSEELIRGLSGLTSAAAEYRNVLVAREDGARPPADGSTG
jgi:hypothetical protein